MIRSLFARFGRDRSGVAFIIFALMAGVLIPLAGGALDYGRALTVRERLATAADAAALALSSAGITDQARARTFTRAFLDANYPDEMEAIDNVVVTIPTLSTEQVRVEISADVNANFLGIVGIEELTASVVAVAVREFQDLDLVFVLDNSFSMYGIATGGDSIPKFQALINAAKTLSDTLFNFQSSTRTVRIGIVPYSSTVNIGDQTQASWIDIDGLSPQHKDHVNLTKGTTLFDLYGDSTETGLIGQTWNGCIRARPGFGQDKKKLTRDDDDVTDNDVTVNTLVVTEIPENETFQQTDLKPSKEGADLEDTSPIVGWTPTFAPDLEGPGKGFHYDKNKGAYIGDRRDYLPGPEEGVDPKDPARYIGGTPSKNAVGPNFGCIREPIRPLSSNQKATTDSIESLNRPRFQTVIPQGLVWGWRVISPKSPYVEAADTIDATPRRVIVLVSDGANNLSSTTFSAYGITPPTFEDLNDKTENVCTNIKNSTDNIAIITITFGTLIEGYSKETIMLISERKAAERARDEAIGAETVAAANKKLAASIALEEAAKKVDDEKAIEKGKIHKKLMKECASPPSQCPIGNTCYFDAPSADDLTTTFNDIGGRLSGIRLTR